MSESLPFIEEQKKGKGSALSSLSLLIIIQCESKDTFESFFSCSLS